MKKILIGSIGTCVHAAGIYNFSKIAEKEGYKVEYLGSSNPIDKIIGSIIEFQPQIVSISYRLSSDGVRKLLNELDEKLNNNNLKDRIFIFGGTIETSAVALEFDFISKIFDGSEEKEESIMFLRNQDKKNIDEKMPQTLRARVEFKKPFPLIRHHIGLDTIEETAEHIKILAESKLLDVISIAPDQNCQQHYFDQDEMNPDENGAGGTPIRNVDDLLKLYDSSKFGNFPLVRCYTGTTNLKKFSKILKDNIDNAWAAIPLTWYSELDRRSERDLLDAIVENQNAIKWNAENNVPVETNESHQWALRYCSDVIEVTTAFLGAYNAKALGVKDYVMQFMLSNPPSISPKMDIAKMVAKIEMIQELENDYFKMIRMIRTGLLAYPADPDAAKGLIASTMFYGAYLKPDIIHAVSYTEAIKRATSKEIIETVKIIKKSFSLAHQGLPDFLADKEIYNRKEELKKEARVLLDAMCKLTDHVEDPLSNAEVIYNSIKLGILDAPGLKGFSVAQGRFSTEILDGKHVSVDKNGKVITEKERLKLLGL